MTDDPRVQQLLDRLLESNATPEEVCASCPELLPVVRKRLRQMRRVLADIDALFPPPTEPTPPPHDATPPHGEAALPRIPGYAVEAVLGRGGVGVVYKARDLRLNRDVALKMLLAGAHAGPEELERFLREAEAVAGLRHANVVQVHEVGDLDGQPYFTMELVEGGSLARQLAGAPLPAVQAANLTAVLADAVEAAHRGGVIHRDLKPANVLLTADGTPKITDFGLARCLEGGGGLTVSGAAMGTPSYMAPEQACGKKDAVGPATDVYALGATLYELLTGRPPFRSETAAATIQQVLTEEPVPPARLNRRTPRDLETICLKCLHKEPTRRYSSAAALAEDLRRFGRGEAIAARAVGPLERAVRWVRRCPGLATTSAASVLLALTLVGVGAWWYEQRSAAARAVEVAAEVELRQAEQFEQKQDYARAADALERAKRRLGDDGSGALRDRLTLASSTLKLLRRLDAIRLDRALVKGGVSVDAMLVKPVSRRPDDGDQLRSGTPPGRRYEEAFREAGLGTSGDDPAEAAARVSASPAREALVAALDDWSACAVDLDQQAWVLAVVGRADDPDPWRDRARDPATWDDRDALAKLADAAPVAEQRPQLLVVLGVRLRTKGGDARAFLSRVVLAHPTDFWANVEMGNTAYWTDKVEAIGYYRAALALRPETASLHCIIAQIYDEQNRLVDCIAHYEEAARLDPNDPYDHNNLAAVLEHAGRRDEAVAEYRTALRINPDYPWAHWNLALTLDQEGRSAEAVDEYREALRLRPQDSDAKQHLRNLLLRLGRLPELRLAWQKDLTASETNHNAWFGYAELCLFLGDEEEYRRDRRELLARFGATTDPQTAERVGRACLLLPASDEELHQAVALAERAVAAGRDGREFAYPYFLFVRGLAEYRQGRFDDAVTTMTGEAAKVMGPCPRLVTAMAQYRQGREAEALMTLAAAFLFYDWNAANARDHNAWIAHILRREAEATIVHLPASAEGND